MTVLNFEAPQSAGLAKRWQALVSDQPKLRIRDAATHLGVSELELVALDSGKGASRLGGNFGELIDVFSLLFGAYFSVIKPTHRNLYRSTYRYIDLL